MARKRNRRNTTHALAEIVTAFLDSEGEFLELLVQV